MALVEAESNDPPHLNLNRSDEVNRLDAQDAAIESERLRQEGRKDAADHERRRASYYLALAVLIHGIEVTFVAALGYDLLVDPRAPSIGQHLVPIAFALIGIPASAFGSMLVERLERRQRNSDEELPSYVRRVKTALFTTTGLCFALGLMLLAAAFGITKGDQAVLNTVRSARAGLELSKTQLFGQNSGSSSQPTQTESRRNNSTANIQATALRVCFALASPLLLVAGSITAALSLGRFKYLRGYVAQEYAQAARWLARHQQLMEIERTIEYQKQIVNNYARTKPTALQLAKEYYEEGLGPHQRLLANREHFLIDDDVASDADPFGLKAPASVDPVAMVRDPDKYAEAVARADQETRRVIAELDDQYEPTNQSSPKQEG